MLSPSQRKQDQIYVNPGSSIWILLLDYPWKYCSDEDKSLGTGYRSQKIQKKLV